MTTHAAKVKPESNGEVETPDAPDDDGIGLNEKSPPLMLGLVTSNQGCQSLMYQSVKSRLWSPAGDWIKIGYTGEIEVGDKTIFGSWRITIKGSGLGIIAHQICKGTRSLLSVGRSHNSLSPITVTSIAITMLAVEGQEE